MPPKNRRKSAQDVYRTRYTFRAGARRAADRVGGKVVMPKGTHSYRVAPTRGRLPKATIPSFKTKKRRKRSY